MATIRAIAVGLPVVASDYIVGPCSIVNHGHNGCLMPEGSVEDHAKHIRLLI